ncbi:MAG: FAD-dependent monooxygenase [Pseudomonadota bacterium]
MMTEKIAIVGAGLGGLVAALTLAKRGADVAVYEQAETLGDVGAGISLTPNASRILEGLGLKDYLAQNAEEPPANQTRHYKTFDMLIDIQRDDTRAEYGAPYYQIHRADLHAAIAAQLTAVAPNCIQTGKALVSIGDLQSGARLHFADDTRVEADVVIAADGLRSRVRAALFDPAQPHHLGQIAYRGLVPREQLSAQWHPGESQNLIGPGAVFVSYPVRQGKLINFVGLAQSDAWAEEGWSIPATKDEILERYAGWHESVAEMVHQAPPSGLRKWGLFGHKPLKAFVRNTVALIGDAAHPMLPFFGMGAAMAMEDGAVIARCLTELGSPSLALKQYEALRMTRSHFVQSESAKGGERLQGADPDAMTRMTVRNEDSLGLFQYDALHMALSI